MNRPSSGSPGSDVARGAGFAAAKGVLLIGLAVVIGIVLLQQVDRDSGSSAATTVTSTNPKTTTTVTTVATATTLPTSVEPAKTPEELHIIVLNHGGVEGAAALMRTQLLQAHYTNSDTANNWEGTQTGNTVLCKAGMEREAVALAVAVGDGTQTPPFPSPAPPYSDNVDCVVAVGASGSSSSSGTANTSTVTTAAAG
jgi:hypothetical protein